MMVLNMWLTHYDLNAVHELVTAVHDLNLFLFIYLEHDKIKRILALSLNWKVNFKLFNPEMHQNESMYLQQCLIYHGSKLYQDQKRQVVTGNFNFIAEIVSR